MNKIQNLQLDQAQRQIIADIAVSASQVSLGSIVIPLTLLGLDQSRIPMIILGLTFTVILWLISILIVKKRGSKK